MKPTITWKVLPSGEASGKGRSRETYVIVKGEHRDTPNVIQFFWECRGSSGGPFKTLALAQAGCLGLEMNLYGKKHDAAIRAAKRAVVPVSKMVKAKAKKPAKKTSAWQKMKGLLGCAILFCKRPARCKGYCAAHYQKYRMLHRTKRLPADWVEHARPGSIRDYTAENLIKKLPAAVQKQVKAGFRTKAPARKPKPLGLPGLSAALKSPRGSRCLCSHAKTRHRDQYGAPHAGKCRDCSCELFETESTTTSGVKAPAPPPPDTFEREARDRQKAAGGDRRPLSAPVALSATPPTARKAATKEGKAAAAAGKSVGVPTRKVERAKWLLKTDPVRAQKVVDGGVTLKKAEREIKRAEQVAQVKVYRPPEGEFSVIVVDFSWKYDDALDGSDAIRGGCPYPPMTIEEICAFPIPVAKDCALFCWVTNSHLIDPNAYAVVAKSLFDRYQLVPKQNRTWRKVTIDGTRDKFGGGYVWRNNTEHLVRFERGRPVFNQVTQTTCFDAPLGEHSEKPQRAFDDIEALCPGGPKLEMFARGDRPGWVTSGSELLKKRALVEESVEEGPWTEPAPRAAPAVTFAPALKWRGGTERVESVDASIVYQISRITAGLGGPGVGHNPSPGKFSIRAGDEVWGGIWQTMHDAKLTAEEHEAKRAVTPALIEAANERQRKRRKKLIIEDVEGTP